MLNCLDKKWSRNKVKNCERKGEREKSVQKNSSHKISVWTFGISKINWSSIFLILLINKWPEELLISNNWVSIANKCVLATRKSANCVFAQYNYSKWTEYLTDRVFSHRATVWFKKAHVKTWNLSSITHSPKGNSGQPEMQCLGTVSCSNEPQWCHWQARD